ELRGSKAGAEPRPCSAAALGVEPRARFGAGGNAGIAGPRAPATKAVGDTRPAFEFAVAVDAALTAAAAASSPLNARCGPAVAVAVAAAAAATSSLLNARCGFAVVVVAAALAAASSVLNARCGFAVVAVVPAAAASSVLNARCGFAVAAV